jgi:adenosylmethionine-8-amino-7-oxononanoate aminotransferase
MSKNLAPKNHVFYRNQNWRYPKIEKAKGIYLYDDSGNAYIDGCSGSVVANIGHGNAEVAAYSKELTERLGFTHLSRWTVDVIETTAKKVADFAPGDLNHVYFVSGGSEATETAIKMARQYFVERDGHSSKWKVISKWNSYHGNTIGALSMTGITSRRKIYDNYLLNFPKIEQFYLYRNTWGLDDRKEMSIKAAEALEQEIKEHGADNIAAFISEPIVGSAAPGIYPDKIYFDKVREICNKYDILLIIDEVMSGFGRTGEKFAVNHYDLVPDILVAAKGMSAGYTPIGCAIANDEIFNTIMVKGSGHFVHGHTYAGNPLSCGIAGKVMDIIERDHIIENAKEQGHYLMERLQGLYAYDCVGDIRGKGLMIGIEFVKDKETKEPFEKSVVFKNKIMEACFQQGLIVYPGGGSVDGELGDHILLAPPLNITREEVDLLFTKLEEGIKKANDDYFKEAN